MTTMDKELKRAAESAYNKWFNRWYDSENLPEKLKNAAQKGFGGLRVYDRMESYPEDEASKYMKRRFEDERFIKLLKQRLPDLTVTRKEWDEQKTVPLFNYKTTRHHYAVTISGW